MKTDMKGHCSIDDPANRGHCPRTCLYKPPHLLLVGNVTYYDTNSGNPKDFIEELLHFYVLAATSRDQNDVASAVFDHPSRYAPAQTTGPSDNDMRAFGIQQASQPRMGYLSYGSAHVQPLNSAYLGVKKGNHLHRIVALRDNNDVTQRLFQSE